MSRPYRVGRGKPPEEHRFEKGRSGNPNGRPRKAAASAKTSATIRKRLLNLARQPMVTKMGGKEVTTTLGEAADILFAQLGLKGSQRALLQVRRELAQAAADEEQDLSDRYKFWRQWKRDHAQARLHCAAHPERNLPWPHPIDIRIDAISRRVTFLGPLDADELPLYLAILEVAELYLIEAELTCRGCHSEDALVRHLRHQAYTAFRSAAPSLAGPGREHDAVEHKLTALALDLRALGLTELRAKRAMLFSKFCAALTTLDLSVPSRPPLHAAPTVRAKSDGAKKRHRLCSIARNPDLRRKVHEHLGDGHGLNRIARLVGATGASRSTLARYVRLYKRMTNSWTINPDVPPKELPASVRAFQNMFGEFQSYLSERDIDEKERLRRGELPVKIQRERGGASPEAINFIKAQLLGLDVEPEPKVLD